MIQEQGFQSGASPEGAPEATAVRVLSAEQGRFFYAGLLEALLQGMGIGRGYLFRHGPRAAVLAHTLGRHIGLGEEELGELFFAGVLADLGMIGLVEDAWENPVAELPPDARAEVHLHPGRSARAARTIPFLSGAEGCIRSHHEWWDGSGYPEGLSGEEIPLAARILRLADTVTALAQERPQRPALDHDEIRAIVGASMGKEFDPRIAELWLSLPEAEQRSDFHKELYRELRQRAVEAVVPPHVTAAHSGILLELFANLIDAKDSYTGGHSRRVALLAGHLTGALGRDAQVQSHLHTAGYLHDLGKLQVPSRILQKNGSLSPEEVEQVRSHTFAGATLLEDVPVLRVFAPGCRHHHERWDGTGYPEGLSGERIPLMARVLAVCDAYDAMTSARAYRAAYRHDQALDELRAAAGTHLPPAEVEAFLGLSVDVFEEVAGLRQASTQPAFLRQPSARRAPGRRGETVSEG